MKSYRFLFRILSVVFVLLFILKTTGFAQNYSNQEFQIKYSKEKDLKKKIDYFFIWISHNAESKKNIEYLEEIVFLTDSIKWYPFEGKALLLLGQEWKKRGEYNEALDRFNHALTIYIKLKDIPKIHTLKLEIADIYRCLGKFELAITILNESMKHYINKKENNQLAYIYSRYAANYLEMFYNSKPYQTIYKDSASNKGEFLTKIMAHPELKKIYKKINYYLELSDSTAISIADTSILISNLIINGQLDVVCFSNDAGINKFNMAIQLMDLSGLDSEKPLVLINKARVFGIWRMNNPQQAVLIAEKALKIAQEKQIRIYIFMASNVLHENYYALQNYEKAYYFLRNSHDIFNILRNENLILKTNSSEFERKIQISERKIQEKKYQQRILIIIILSISLISSIFIILLFDHNRKQKILLQNLREKSTIIFNQNNDLQMVIAEKDKLFSIIGHDLKTPFNSILGFAELITEEYDQLSKEEILTYCNYILKSSNKTLNLLDNLLVWAKLQQNRIVFDPKELELFNIVTEVGLVFNETLMKKNILFENDIHEDTVVFADEEMLKTILRNLISNGIKFSNSEGKIVVSAQIKPEGTEITISDNGVGISKTNIEKIQQFNSQVITIGTENEKGSGLGLIICKDMIEKHGGSFRIESELSKGSKFIILIPYMNNLIK